MAHTRKDEARALDKDEHALVERSHQPDIAALGDSELIELLKLVRERRDRAQRLARQQRRELRGKSAPKGMSPATGDAGSKRKLEVLAMAVRRLNSELDRRKRASARAQDKGKPGRSAAGSAS